MNNPLAIRRGGGGDTPFFGPRYGTQEWCDWRNDTMPRDDIEWVLDGKGGAYLRDRAGWSADHAKRGERAAEDERRKWIWRHNNPQAVRG